MNRSILNKTFMFYDIITSNMDMRWVPKKLNQQNYIISEFFCLLYIAEMYHLNTSAKTNYISTIKPYYKIK